MLTVTRTNWWVRWVLFGGMLGRTQDNLRRGKPVSLCVLFWAGMFPLLISGGLLSLLVGLAVELIQNAAVKEFAVVVLVVAAVIGALIWRGLYLERHRNLDAKFIPVPTIVSTIFWGIKHWVCPMVRVED